jgi:hypothetical protein
VLRLVNKQFEILGLTTRFEHIPESGIIDSGKKKDYWYNVYKLTEEQEKQWEDWALAELKKLNPLHAEALLRDIGFKYGMIRVYKKRGELF